MSQLQNSPNDRSPAAPRGHPARRRGSVTCCGSVALLSRARRQAKESNHAVRDLDYRANTASRTGKHAVADRIAIFAAIAGAPLRLGELHRGSSTLAGGLAGDLARFPMLSRREALEKRAQDRIVTEPIIPLAAGFGSPESRFFLQEPLLDVPLHLHAIEVFVFHSSTSSLGEWMRGLRYPLVRLIPS